MRYQQFGHTKNYCRKNPRFVKCAAQHLTRECPRKTKDDNVKCVNCHEKHPANYRGCMIHKKYNKNIPKTKRTSHRKKTTSNRSNLRSDCTRTNRTASNKRTPTPHNEHGTSSKRPNRTQTNDEKPARSDGHAHQLNNGAHQQK
jgi:hypothetical protein